MINNHLKLYYVVTHKYTAFGMFEEAYSYLNSDLRRERDRDILDIFIAYIYHYKLLDNFEACEEYFKMYFKRRQLKRQQESLP